MSELNLGLFRGIKAWGSLRSRVRASELSYSSAHGVNAVSRFPDGRDQIDREPNSQHEWSERAATTTAAIDRESCEQHRSPLDRRDDPQILDWDQMSVSNLSNIHLL